MIEAWAPGKLFIAGEYAVVDAGEPSILVAVNRGILVRVTDAPEAPTEQASEYVRAACRAVEQLRAERSLPSRSYALEIETELEDHQGRKFGLGSSAAVTVAVVRVLSELYSLQLTRLQRFQLALLATIEVSPQASGGDLAASTFGGWIRYTSPDREALRVHRERHGITASFAPELWRGCEVTELPAPREVRLLVGWTGSPASTKHLVNDVRRGSSEAAAERTAFLSASRKNVEALATELRRGGDGTPHIIRNLRRVLQRLAAASGIEIETPELRALCEAAERAGAAGKPSGAGGGDCGIVLAGPHADTDAMIREWSRCGILNLDLQVQPSEGVVNER